MTDRLVYRFEPVADEPARWKRTDLDLWCGRAAEGNWAILDGEGKAFGWPREGRGDEDRPPAGRWVSAKEGKSYEYELVWVSVDPKGRSPLGE